MSHAISHQISIPISENLYMDLAKLYKSGISSVIEQILEDHLSARACDLSTQEKSMPSLDWAPLTLPHGTLIRTRYYGEFLIAEITDGILSWNNQTFSSVCQAINAMKGNTRNNAWKCTEIKRPSDPNWKLADHIRYR